MNSSDEFRMYVCENGHVHQEVDSDHWKMEPEEAIEAAGMLRQAAKQAMKAREAKND